MKTHSEAVVDIHHRHPGGATVEHAEERRDLAETGVITDDGRDLCDPHQRGQRNHRG